MRLNIHDQFGQIDLTETGMAHGEVILSRRHARKYIYARSIAFGMVNGATFEACEFYVRIGNDRAALIRNKPGNGARLGLSRRGMRPAQDCRHDEQTERKVTQNSHVAMPSGTVCPPLRRNSPTALQNIL
jgi:hypothetical protein